MSERNRYEQAVQLLIHARRPARSRTPERLEENLRWLMRETVPETRASEALWQRVRALAEAHRARLNARRATWAELQRWHGLEAELTAAEREMLALLLMADIGLLPEDVDVRGEARQVTQRLLAALPEPLREALLLQVVQGLSLSEIAQVLDCSEGEVSRLLQQARASIFRSAQRDSGSAPQN